MYLTDTNIWLERLLDQEHSAKVGQMLAQVPANEMCLSDFTLHSIAIILCKLGKLATFVEFVEDLLSEAGTCLVSVPVEAMRRLVEVMERYRLDFDDAYQYVAAEQVGALIVSLDGDLDRTDKGRETPASILRILPKLSS